MPELILLALLSATALGLLVFLFLRLNQSQLELIKHLTQTNQSLVNQVRAKDVASLTGLQYATNSAPENEDPYLTTEDRELAAWRASLAQQHEIGDLSFDDDDLSALREAL